MLVSSVRQGGVAGPEVGGRDAVAAKRATSVQPSLARTSSPLRSISARSNGWSSDGGAPVGDSPDTSNVSPSSSVDERAAREACASASTARAVRCEAVVHAQVALVGHDVAGHAALDEHRLHRLAVLAAVETGRRSS